MHLKVASTGNQEVHGPMVLIVAQGQRHSIKMFLPCHLVNPLILRLVISWSQFQASYNFTTISTRRSRGNKGKKSLCPSLSLFINKKQFPRISQARNGQN